MILIPVITPLVAFFAVSPAHVRYATEYGNPRGSLSTVACSNGENGLLTRGFTTFGSLPTFPYIGGAQAVGGWNSPACGSCWQISYGGKSINVTAVDSAGDGFNLSLEAMDSLTNGRAKEFGVINAKATQIDECYCGM